MDLSSLSLSTKSLKISLLIEAELILKLESFGSASTRLGGCLFATFFNLADFTSDKNAAIFSVGMWRVGTPDRRVALP